MAWGKQPARSRGSAVLEWRLFGIPIHLDASWFFIVTFIAWSLGHDYFPTAHPGFASGAYGLMGAAASLLLFACVLLHELSHSLVAQGYGIQVIRVKLFIFGGVAQIGGRPPRPAVELLVALAGPLMSALIAWGCAVWSSAIHGTHPFALAAAAILRYLTTINVAILLFNLLPGFPLDGGRVLRALLWALSGDLRQATRIASLLGAGFGIGLIILGAWTMAAQGRWTGGLWLCLLGSFLWGAARTSYRLGAG